MWWIDRKQGRGIGKYISVWGCLFTGGRGVNSSLDHGTQSTEKRHDQIFMKSQRHKVNMVTPEQWVCSKLTVKTQERDKF